MTDERIPQDDLSDPDLTAAELALNLLEGDELASALRRLLAEPGFASDVEMWRTHFAQLFVSWPEVTPPETALARIERAIDRPQLDPSRRGSGLWRGVAIASMLAAACLLLVVLLRPGVEPAAPLPPPAPTTPATLLVAQLAPAGKGEPVAALYDPGSGGLRVAESLLAQPNRSAELWVIPSDGVPRALGLLNDHDRTKVAVDAANRSNMRVGSTLAISIEPVGGSTTGKPTGPVVASGALTLV